MDALLLAIDTATTCSSIAITRGNLQQGEVLASLSLNTRVTHSRRLLSSIEWLMGEIDLSWEDLGGIVVNLGPGSFTGLRIGLASAKGLAMAANLPLYGVSSLEILASRVSSDKPICACLDARKKEVYSAFFKWQDGQLVQITENAVWPATKMVESLREPTVIVGDGTINYSEAFEGHELARLAPAALHITSAEALGLCGGTQKAQGNALDLAASAPIYVRASDAELNLGIKVPASSQDSAKSVK